MSKFSTIAAANPFANPVYGIKAAESRQFSAASVIENSPLRVFSAAAGTSSVVPGSTEYYLKGAFAGGVCCSITHGAVCPVDVVKTRMQLEPEVRRPPSPHPRHSPPLPPALPRSCSQRPHPRSIKYPRACGRVVVLGMWCAVVDSGCTVAHSAP